MHLDERVLTHYNRWATNCQVTVGMADKSPDLSPAGIKNIDLKAQSRLFISKMVTFSIDLSEKANYVFLYFLSETQSKISKSKVVHFLGQKCPVLQ